MMIRGTAKPYGPFFHGDAAERVRKNLQREIKRITEDGKRIAQAGVKPKHPTGFTQSHIEARTYPLERQGPIYGKVRMEQGLKRGDNPAAAYIVAHVLESGRYGGHKQKTTTILANGKTRSRTRWKRGSKSRVALRMFAKAEKVMKQEAAHIAPSKIIEGLT